MSYDNTNSGILRANQRKTKDTHPTHQGSINVEGKEYWLSAWVKTGRDGTKLAGERYFSLSVKPKDEQAPEQKPPARQEDNGGFDDDIPF